MSERGYKFRAAASRRKVEFFSEREIRDRRLSGITLDRTRIKATSRPGAAEGFGIRDVPGCAIEVPALTALQTSVRADPPSGVLLYALFPGGANN